ncbi:MAG: dihydroorotase [Trueperaceae bacterium]|nr:dihydroorotase [Trueperaceae bacterium]
MRSVIKNVHLLDGTTDYGTGDLYIKDSLIEGINLSGEVDETIDGSGLTLCPAFIDLHAHLREPGQEVKEDLASGLAAAAAGGFGSVVSMANTKPTVDEAGIVADLVAKARKIGQARLFPAASLSHGLKGETLTDFGALKQAGAVMITDDGIPVQDSHLMRRACEYARELDLVIQTHSEDPGLRQSGVMNEGLVSQRLGLPGNPISAEAIMIFRDCEVAAMTGARVHIAHVSSKRGMQVIEWFKAQGHTNITAEVTPHHLTLDDSVFESFDTIYKVAPPLRTAEDVAYLRKAITKGVVDSIGTDHAPHTQAEKDLDMLQAPFGIPNIELTFPLLYSELVEKGAITLTRLIELLTVGPAKVMKWDIPTLEAGKAADLVLLDLATEKPVTPKSFKSKAKFSPWTGQNLKGWPVRTLVAGKPVYSA